MFAEKVIVQIQIFTNCRSSSPKMFIRKTVLIKLPRKNAWQDLMFMKISVVSPAIFTKIADPEMDILLGILLEQLLPGVA